jgi:tRNA nucleotidyltransferase/poly(A) polymerase
VQDGPIDLRAIPPEVRQVLARLDDRGFESWLVGGCVRDLCLGQNPKDFDLATSARPEQVQQLFPRHIATGLEHGTVTVIWHEAAVEITTFRSEGTYSDSRRPDLVIFHDQIEADLARRDFTMNSLAFHPDRGLLDLHGGLSDLRRGVLRSVGEPAARFEEDALRLLRAVRFAVTYDLTPDPDLVQAAAWMADRLVRLSRERVAMEMMSILGAPYPKHLEDFRGCGLLSAAVACLLAVAADDRVLCERLSRLIHPDLLPVQRLPLLYLAAAAASLDAAGLRQTLLPWFRPAAGHRMLHLLMHESRVSRHAAAAGEAMLFLLNLRLMLPLQELMTPVTRCQLLRLLARRCHLESDGIPPIAAAAGQLLHLLLTGSLDGGAADSGRDFAVPEQIPLTLAGLAINGRQLQQAGWRAGPAMRVLLERLLSLAIVRPELNKAADLLARARLWSGNERNLSYMPGRDL